MGARDLAVPPNITLLPLPAKCPELNPVENVWQFMRDNWLSNRVFSSYADILDHCYHAWSRLGSRRDVPGRSPEASKLMSIIAAAARSEARLGFEQQHCWRRDDRRVLPIVDPSVDGIGPFLHHMAALHPVLGLIVNTARQPAVLVR